MTYTSTATRSSMSMFCRWRWPRFGFDLEKLEVKKWGWPTKCFFWPMKTNHTALATGADLADLSLTGHLRFHEICLSFCDFTRFFYQDFLIQFRFFDHSAISRDFSIQDFLIRVRFDDHTAISRDFSIILSFHEIFLLIKIFVFLFCFAQYCFYFSELNGPCRISFSFCLSA